MNLKFQNFETNKLYIDSPNIYNLLIVCILILIIIVAFKKEDVEFIGIVHTTQLKGLAILFVVIGHLWGHVSVFKPDIMLSREGVTLFFILSGFGLTISNSKVRHGLKTFVTRRISRVYVPYWIATVFILVLDYFLLNRLYSGKDIVLTTLGINIEESTRHIDFVRWFVTLLVFWYAIFYLTAKVKIKNLRIIIMLACAAVLLITNYYKTHFVLYRIFAFPVGCALGLYYDEIRDFTKKNIYGPINFYSALPVLGICVFLIFHIYISSLIANAIPGIIFLVLEEGISIIFSLSVILILGYLGSCKIKSRFLYFTGLISYELFLIHGPFLVKYNFILSGKHLITSFYAYLFAILLISFLFNLLNRQIKV